MNIDKTLALKIIRKLKAKIVKDSKNRPHDMYSVEVEGILVTSLGIRRGSKKSQGHMHVIDQLQLRPREAADLGHCPLSYEEWLEICKDRGML